MLYLIYSPEMHCLDDEIIRIKIGFSKNPEKKLQEFQVGSPVQLELLRTLEICEYIESSLHIFFHPYHVRGKWYDFTQHMVIKLMTYDANELEDWIHDCVLKLTLREVGGSFLLPSQYHWFTEFLNYFDELEKNREVIVSTDDILDNLWKNLSFNEVEKRITILKERLKDFILVELLDHELNTLVSKTYKIQWLPERRSEKDLTNFYQEIIPKITTGPELLKSLEPVLSELQYQKMKYLIQGFPQLLERGEIVRSTVDIKNKVPNLDSNKVFTDFKRIGEKTKLFTIEKVLVDQRGEIIDDPFGNEEKLARRGGRQKKNGKKKCRYVKILLKGVRDDFR